MNAVHRMASEAGSSIYANGSWSVHETSCVLLEQSSLNLFLLRLIVHFKGRPPSVHSLLQNMAVLLSSL